MPDTAPRVVLIDPSPAREDLANELRAQGYVVDLAADGATGADLALSSPPDAIVADLWMPGMSGVQLCRLIAAEPATSDVPFILRGESGDRRERFWAKQAGAVACVLRGRVPELVSALEEAIAARVPGDGFFMQLSGGRVAVGDRIARHLDRVFFESVIAAEVRSLATSASTDRLLERFALFFSQICSYRWLALATTPSGPGRVAEVGLHHGPHDREAAEREAMIALELPETVKMLRFENDDVASGAPAAAPLVRPILFGDEVVGRLAISPGREPIDDALVGLVARDLSGPIRLTALVEDARRLADTDPLTSLMNRRAFVNALKNEMARCARHRYPLALLVLDVDHFKKINDVHGHGCGDLVLSSMGSALKGAVRAGDFVGRWGGEEFVLALTRTDAQGGLVAAERIRAKIEALQLSTGAGEMIPVTASIGLAEYAPGETVEQMVERGDQAMYRAKVGGRNRVIGPESEPSQAPSAASDVAR